MSDWCEAHEEWVNDGATCYVCGIAKAERERIIKLLEDESDDGWPTGIKHLEIALPTLIALIKGEQNSWTSRPLTDEDKEHYGKEGEQK